MIHVVIDKNFTVLLGGLKVFLNPKLSLHILFFFQYTAKSFTNHFDESNANLILQCVYTFLSRRYIFTFTFLLYILQNFEIFIINEQFPFSYILLIVVAWPTYICKPRGARVA